MRLIAVEPITAPSARPRTAPPATNHLDARMAIQKSIGDVEVVGDDEQVLMRALGAARQLLPSWCRC